RHGDFRMLGPQIEQARDPVDARHRQVEQNEIDLTACSKPIGEFVKGAGLLHVGVLERGLQGLAQRPSKQWVVIDDDELVGGHLWIRCASSLRNGAWRPSAASASWPGNLAFSWRIG